VDPLIERDHHYTITRAKLVKEGDRGVLDLLDPELRRWADVDEHHDRKRRLYRLEILDLLLGAVIVYLEILLLQPRDKSPIAVRTETGIVTRFVSTLMTSLGSPETTPELGVGVAIGVDRWLPFRKLGGAPSLVELCPAAPEMTGGAGVAATRGRDDVFVWAQTLDPTSPAITARFKMWRFI